MTIKDFGDLVIYAGAIAGALGAIGTVLYWTAVRPFRRWLREQIGVMRAAAEQTRDTAQAVHAEVTPNHGSSLKDAVDRIEVEVRQVRAELVDHITYHPGEGQQ